MMGKNTRYANWSCLSRWTNSPSLEVHSILLFCHRAPFLFEKKFLRIYLQLEHKNISSAVTRPQIGNPKGIKRMLLSHYSPTT